MKYGTKITIIMPYFGRWPAWIDYFFLSCKMNPDVNWLFFTDQQGIEAENLSFIPFTLKDFNELASRKLGFDIELRHPYKICDLKPAYGDIFEDYIPDSQFWGYGDLDLIYGKIQNFLPDRILESFDIISNHPDFVTGHFCILRNIPEVRGLYRAGGAYRKAFLNQKYTGFDEQLKRMAINPDPAYMHLLKKIDLSAHILLTSLVKTLKSFRKKRLGVHANKIYKPPADFSSIVGKALSTGKLNVHYSLTFQSDLMLRKQGKRSWSITWENGNLINESDGKGLLYFHFILSKSRKSFEVENALPDIKKFSITSKGISA